MTTKKLYLITSIVVAFYLFAFATGIVLRILFPDIAPGRTDAVYGTYKDMMPFLVAVPAAWLGYCFQRRSSYLTALRELWNILIPSVQQAVQFTHLEKPTHEHFSRTMQDLSIVIDSMRGVFKNIPTNEAIGLYPYENIKDIEKIVGWLGFKDNFNEHNKYWARRCMLTLWASMHQAMLQEFDRETPTYPLSRYLDNSPSLVDKLKNGKISKEDIDNEEKLQRERLTKMSN